MQLWFNPAGSYTPHNHSLTPQCWGNGRFLDNCCGKCPGVTLSWARGLSPNWWVATVGTHLGSDVEPGQLPGFRLHPAKGLCHTGGVTTGTAPGLVAIPAGGSLTWSTCTCPRE